MPPPTYATKRAALDQVLAQLERNGTSGPEPVLPEQFADASDLLAAAHRRWHSHLGARIDAAMETGEAPATAVGGAYRETVRAMPVLRRLLDSHSGHPVLARAEHRELSLLAWAAGLTSPTTTAARAAELGREFRDAVRAEESTRTTITEPGSARSWLRRLKNVADTVKSAA